MSEISSFGLRPPPALGHWDEQIGQLRSSHALQSRHVCSVDPVAGLNASLKV